MTRSQLRNIASATCEPSCMAQANGPRWMPMEPLSARNQPSAAKEMCWALQLTSPMQHRRKSKRQPCKLQTSATQHAKHAKTWYHEHCDATDTQYPPMIVPAKRDLPKTRAKREHT
eukprot:CAMPEP_0204270384 /NCGR_PEP_ID=MMETSP0468-20130131/18866_1 /ASSEMBLY_ACC=CAM_ASM_000383 /TAXON_ID=2969 /ORGANISM="Oxyrrhis marina" /LENGTH=115 /DNA_ID=CAMNT_0051245913 /DNA_START=156 /DNA_END=503 /DNA_ORIENTATION=+